LSRCALSRSVARSLARSEATRRSSDMPPIATTTAKA
jgi:hypothetical protein